MSPSVPEDSAFTAHFTASSGAVPPLSVSSSMDMMVVRREKYGDDERAV